MIEVKDRNGESKKLVEDIDIINYASNLNPVVITSSEQFNDLIKQADGWNNFFRGIYIDVPGNLHIVGTMTPDGIIIPRWSPGWFCACNGIISFMVVQHNRIYYGQGSTVSGWQTTQTSSADNIVQ